MKYTNRSSFVQMRDNLLSEGKCFQFFTSLNNPVKESVIFSLNFLLVVVVEVDFCCCFGGGDEDEDEAGNGC